MDSVSWCQKKEIVGGDGLDNLLCLVLVVLNVQVVGSAEAVWSQYESGLVDYVGMMQVLGTTRSNGYQVHLHTAGLIVTG